MEKEMKAISAPNGKPVTGEPPIKSPTKPHGGGNKKYEFRFGGATWFVELLIAVTLGTTVLGVAWNNLSFEDFEKYFQPILGYIFLSSAIQGAFFKFKHVPTPAGYARYLLSVPVGIAVYFAHTWMFTNVFHIVHVIMTPIHLSFIIPTFLLIGIDHPLFGGKLLGWIRGSVLQFLFTYFLSWMIWIVFVLSPLFVNAGESEDKNHNMTRLYLYMALWLSTVVGKLFLQFLCKAWLDEVFTYDVIVPSKDTTTTLNAVSVNDKGTLDVESQNVVKRELNNTKRGWSAMAMAVSYSFVSTFFVFVTVNYIYAGQVTEALMMKSAFNALASPLLFILTAGPYSDCFKSWHGKCSGCQCRSNHGRWRRGEMSWGHLTFIRFLLTLFFSLISYLFFNLVIGSLHIVGEPWVKGYNLMWNMAGMYTTP
jgi:hypothetical protein